MKKNKKGFESFLCKLLTSNLFVQNNGNTVFPRKGPISKLSIGIVHRDLLLSSAVQAESYKNDNFLQASAIRTLEIRFFP